MQTFTFYASDDKLENRGQNLKISVSGRLYPPNKYRSTPVPVAAFSINCDVLSGGTNQRGGL